MGTIKDIIRKLVPTSLLEKYREAKKEKTRKSLVKQAESGNSLTDENLIEQFLELGIKDGDSVLVHSSLSKIGHIEGGALTFIQALIAVVGENGNILMPTSPNAVYQEDYIQSLDVFDVTESPSRLGKITEVFRTYPGVMRSENATEPVSCFGPDAFWFTEGHFGELTPYTENSPFARLAQKKGKILYVGVTLANAGTSLHVLEDAVLNFKFPVYAETIYSVKVKSATGEVKEYKTKVHNKAQSALRKCDELIPLFEADGVLKKGKLGTAEVLVLDASDMLNSMIKHYFDSGVTMYTPKGS